MSKTVDIHVRFHKDKINEMSAYEYLKSQKNGTMAEIIADLIASYSADRSANRNRDTTDGWISDKDVERIARAVATYMKEHISIIERSASSRNEEVESREDYSMPVTDEALKFAADGLF